MAETDQTTERLPPNHPLATWEMLFLQIIEQADNIPPNISVEAAAIIPLLLERNDQFSIQPITRRQLLTHSRHKRQESWISVDSLDPEEPDDPKTFTRRQMHQFFLTTALFSIGGRFVTTPFWKRTHLKIDGTGGPYRVTPCGDSVAIGWGSFPPPASLSEDVVYHTILNRIHDGMDVGFVSEFVRNLEAVGREMGVHESLAHFYPIMALVQPGMLSQTLKERIHDNDLGKALRLDARYTILPIEIGADDFLLAMGAIGRGEPPKNPAELLLHLIQTTIALQLNQAYTYSYMKEHFPGIQLATYLMPNPSIIPAVAKELEKKPRTKDLLSLFIGIYQRIHMLNCNMHGVAYVEIGNRQLQPKDFWTDGVHPDPSGYRNLAHALYYACTFSLNGAPYLIPRRPF